MTQRFAMTAPQRRFLLAVQVMGRMDVTGPAASSHCWNDYVQSAKHRRKAYDALRAAIEGNEP